MKRARTEDTEDRTSIKRHRCEQGSAALSKRQASIASALPVENGWEDDGPHHLSDRPPSLDPDDWPSWKSFNNHESDREPDNMGSRQVGDLLGVRAVTDFFYDIPRSARTPPKFMPSAASIEAFERKFGVGSYGSIDSLATSISPNPKEYKRGCAALEMFLGDWATKEPKFAGSKLWDYLLPKSNVTIGFEHGQILSVELDHQTSLYEDTQDGYLVPSQWNYQSVSASKISDGSYCLVVPRNTEVDLRDDLQANTYPCLHAKGTCILPFLSLEVKVDGAHRKQTLQQAFYRAWYIYRQLILRALTKGESTSDLNGIKHHCISMSDNILECWEYTPWKNPEARANSLRVKAKLLCKGSMRDEVWFTDVYCPWRLFIVKEAIFNQAVHLLPDIESYAARPQPRPFDLGGRALVYAKEFVLENFVGVSFSNELTEAHRELGRNVDKWRWEQGYTSTAKQKRLSESNSRQNSFSQSFELDSNVTPTDDGIATMAPPPRQRKKNKKDNSAVDLSRLSRSNKEGSSTTSSAEKYRVPGLMHLPLKIEVDQLVQPVDAVLANGLGHNLIDKGFCGETGIPTEPKGAPTTLTTVGGHVTAITHQKKPLRLTAVCGHSETLVLDVMDSKGLYGPGSSSTIPRSISAVQVSGLSRVIVAPTVCRQASIRLAMN
ncbi:MAG: hypothetical protein M1816_007812 [Peltula sp. TS41687]|nr:MAG: hypothetical protein M1816_007812 [Peltula sp. TS41687]